MKEGFEDEDVFLQYIGIVTRTQTKNHDLPLYGRLVSASREWLTFEKVDGRGVLVRRSEVLTIEPTRSQDLV